jgi:sortase A
MKTAVYLFAAIALLALGYCAFEFLRARTYQAREKGRFAHNSSLDGTSRSSPPAKKDPLHPTAGSAVAMLLIPRLGLSSIVIEGAEDAQLKLGPGHIRGTSFPGDGGNIGIAGHRDTFFRPLRYVRKDDTIEVTAYDREYSYKVVSTAIVSPDDVTVLYPQGR